MMDMLNWRGPSLLVLRRDGDRSTTGERAPPAPALKFLTERQDVTSRLSC